MSPLPSVKLNDGTMIPILGFGTGNAHMGQDISGLVETAYKVGYHHIDCAEMYENENFVGKALQNVVKSRNEVFITGKVGEHAIPDVGLKRSLEKLQVPQVDLYLVHSRMFAQVLGLSKCWEQMESLQHAGLTKSVGVSNYRLSDLEKTVKAGKIIPSVLQIEFHPYLYVATKPLLDYCHANQIVIGCWGPLRPITDFSGGAVDDVIDRIAKDLGGATTGQVLLKWAQQVSRGYVLTTSNKKERMETQLKAFTGLRPLTEEELDSITEAGATAHHRAGQHHMDE